MTVRSTSAKGRAFLRSHEGEVLKAYRCPAGKWTIGIGLTAASGVVKPKPGMTITQEESDSLLTAALARNYEPRVNEAMPDAQQHEFDGGTSFDFNTGAIHRASWLKAWKRGDYAGVRDLLMQWVKGGGKVLPGLKRRRAEEANIIIQNRWPIDLKVQPERALAPTDKLARFVVSVDPEEVAAIRSGFREIGFEPGPLDGMVLRSTVEDFQRRYDLTVDGLIGRATLSTLQRELDARRKAAPAAGAAGGSGAVAAGNEATAPDPAAATDASWLGDPVVTWIGVGIGVLALVFLAWLAWHYRDLIAARLAGRFPKLATWLRSF